MIYHNRQRNILSIIPKLCINRHTIDRVKDFNFLGITFDEHMTWDMHIHKTSTKITKTLGVMTRLKRYLPTEILLMIYNSLIMPHIQYGILCWGHKFGRVLKLQKRAMRLITCSKYNSHTEPLYKKLKCLKVSDLYTLNMLKFYYKVDKGTIPHYFKDMFSQTETNSTHTHDTRYRNNYTLPRSNTTTGSTCLRYFLPQVLRNTPQCIMDKVTTHSPFGFSNYIKQHFLKITMKYV